MKETSLPENVRRLGDHETFRFSCHPGVPCFTECCRQLDLPLTPYDVIRLRRALGISSTEFLERYVLVEKNEADIFPQLFLTMVDDGRASCPLVGELGCTVYQNRPGACRTYPVGRGAFLDQSGRPDDFHVLLTEPHCQGFAAGPELSMAEWTADQELNNYNKLNDEVMSILHHRRIREGFRPDDSQQQRYLNVLYDLDAFRQEIGARDIEDQELLRKAIKTLHHELFNGQAENG